MSTVLLGLILSMPLGALNQMIMAPAPPAVANSLRALDEMPGIVSAYPIAVTVVMPVHGKSGDRFGRKPAIQTVIEIFVIGAVLRTVTGSMSYFPALRVVQGIVGTD